MILKGICIGGTIALILPGISVSYVLLLMGLYEKTITALSELQLDFLGSLAIGGIIGVLLTTKFLQRTMEKHPISTYLKYIEDESCHI